MLKWQLFLIEHLWVQGVICLPLKGTLGRFLLYILVVPLRFVNNNKNKNKKKDNDNLSADNWWAVSYSGNEVAALTYGILAEE